MLSRPFARLRGATAARLTRATSRVAPLAAALLLAACATSEESPAAPAKVVRPAPTRESARDLAYTATSEIRFDGELVGYLVEVLPVPGGVVDERAFEPGTALIQDTKFEFIGFISPRGTTYHFDKEDQAKPVGFGSRNKGIAAFFRRNGDPQIVSLHPGG